MSDKTGKPGLVSNVMKETRLINSMFLNINSTTTINFNTSVPAHPPQIISEVDWHLDEQFL